MVAILIVIAVIAIRSYVKLTSGYLYEIEHVKKIKVEIKMCHNIRTVFR